MVVFAVLCCPALLAAQIDLPFSRTVELVEQGAWQEILEHCQLGKEKAQNRVFYGFSEGPLLFPPSYRYVSVHAYRLTVMEFAVVVMVLVLVVVVVVVGRAGK